MTDKEFDVLLFKDNVKDLFQGYMYNVSTFAEKSMIEKIWREINLSIENSYR